MQIAYSETEGYVPVTSKAQNSETYQDYLSRAGEDNNQYYDVKIQASQLLLDHMDDTFVTPVFNGSTSLRNAAGELIESVTKSMRRSETVDDAYIAALFDEVSSLYHLDQAEGLSSGKADLGPLPQTAIILLSALAAVWVLIILYVLWQWKKSRRKKNA